MRVRTCTLTSSEPQKRKVVVTIIEIRTAPVQGGSVVGPDTRGALRNGLSRTLQFTQASVKLWETVTYSNRN